MITVRPAAERLHTKIGWLDSRHTFSFGEHYDPRYMGYRALRVINEDRVAPGKGFGTQIWLLPEKPRLAPSYEQRTFSFDNRRGRLTLIGSRDGREHSITIHQDVDLFSAVLNAGDRASHALRAGRHAWVHVARGRVELNGTPLSAGDGAAMDDKTAVELTASATSDVLVFDLA